MSLPEQQSPRSDQHPERTPHHGGRGPVASSRPTRHAIVGTGGIAGVQAEHACRLGGQMELVAAVDVDPERLTAYADRWGVSRRYRSLGDLLRDGDVDVVHLCTPPGLHAEHAIEALEAGVPVLCEKPPALTLEAMDRIRAAEARSTASFGTIFQHRFGSGGQRLQRVVGDPRLGRPLTAVCHTLWYRPDSYFTPQWRGRWGVEGGGPTMGHGIHQMDLLLAALGPWREVVAVSARQVRATNTEDLASAIVTFENGAVATIVNSFLSVRETSYLRFDSEHATVEVDHLYGYSDGDWRVTPAADHKEDVLSAWEEGPSGLPSGHAAQFAAVADAVRERRSLPVTSEQSRLTLELVAAIYASSFGGAPVKRGEIGPGSPFYTAMDGPGAPWPDVKEQH